MGSSCTSGKKQIKSKKQEIPSEISKASIDKCNKDAFLDQGDQGNTNNTLQVNRHSTFTRSSDEQNSQPAKSPQQITAPHSHPRRISSFNSKISRLSNLSCQYSDKPSQSRVSMPKRSNQLELFIKQRKIYMENRGVFVYNAQTILPPPVLKNTNASSLLKKRRSEAIAILKKFAMNSIQDIRINNMPTNMLNGDLDQVMIEV